MQQYTIQPGVLLTPLDCAEKSAGSARCFACAVVFLSFFLLVLALGLQRRGRTTECPVPSVDAERSVQVDTPPKSSSSFLFFIHPYLHHHHQQSNTTNLMEYSESF